MMTSPQIVPRNQQRRQDSLPHFKTGAPITVRALALWEQTLSTRLAEAHPFRFTASLTGNKADDKEGYILERDEIARQSTSISEKLQLHPS